MINDVEMRWVLRWWWGIIPHWKLQYRTQELIQPGASPNVMSTRWTPWKDVKAAKDDHV